jgi:hypothetical protein
MKATTIQFAQLAVAAIALFSGAVLATVAVRTFVRGPIPAKHLNSLMLSTYNVLDDLHNAGSAITTSVIDASGNKIDNIYNSTIYLTNTGEAPIVPADFYGKVKLLTKDPWMIITINSPSDSGSPSFNWHKVSDTEFEADPILISPHDEIASNVYITTKTPKPDITAIPLDWDVRIANLSHIDYGNLKQAPQSTFPQLLNLYVVYAGNNILLFLILFVAYLSSYVYYLFIFGHLTGPLTSVIKVVLASVFAIFAADTSVTYVTKPLDTIYHILNAPILFLNFLCLCWIVFKIHQQVRGTRERELIVLR